jgi:hypothetical protein
MRHARRVLRIRLEDQGSRDGGGDHFLDSSEEYVRNKGYPPACSLCVQSISVVLLDLRLRGGGFQQ